jgi:uncharacterized membrane protein YcaP (DUF421 family)
MDLLRDLLGPASHPDDLGVGQVALRAALVYAFLLGLVRFAHARLLGKATPFDIAVSILIGSVMSGAIDGSSPLLPTLAAGAVLVGMHALFASAAFHTSWFGKIVKGQRILLIADGEIREEGMAEAKLSRRDLEEALRLQASETDPAAIKRAWLERNGDISVIPY